MAAKWNILQEACEAAARDTSLQVSGIVWLEHINLGVGSKAWLTAFYFDGLGLTKDPSINKETNVWGNIGRQQFHFAVLDDENAHVLAGSIGLALPPFPPFADASGGLPPGLLAASSESRKTMRSAWF